MKIANSDEEKLILSKEDVKVLYSYLRDCMILPKYGIEVSKLEFMKHLWDTLSIIASPDDFQEENPGFKVPIRLFMDESEKIKEKLKLLSEFSYAEDGISEVHSPEPVRKVRRGKGKARNMGGNCW
jgi:hypothetical protein